LGVSEAELVSIGPDNKLLLPEFSSILNDIPELGEVMALTRNNHAVHERKGIYTKASFHGQIGLVTNPDIDLRLFMTDWTYVFAVHENNRKSIQFFDRFGDAIHKIYLTENSNADAFERLVAKYILNDPPTVQIEVKPFQASIEKLDEDIDVNGFQNEWKSLQDTHDFFGILKKYEVSRLQSMRLAPKGFTYNIPVEEVESLLNLVSSSGIEFMVFAGNKSCLQIHTGKAEKIVRTGPWINILDDKFNLHLNDSEIDSLWIVKKPTNLGLVHSIEAFDREGNLIIQFFGKRKPSIPESEDWRKIVKSIENQI
jgi:putative hemin transport protein